MKIFAHRGLVFEFPENTLLSFEKSLERGFGLELDVHRTKEGEVVVIHDSNAKRITNVDINIYESELSFLRTLDFGQGQKIPTLKETINLFYQRSQPNTEIAIQIKDCNQEDIEKLIVNVLDKFNQEHPEFNIYERVFIFDPIVSSAKKFKELQPKLKISLSIGENELFPSEGYPTIFTYDAVINVNYEIVWADEWVKGLYSKDFINKCHQDGKLVYAISPELHRSTTPKHPLSEQGYEEVWKKLIEWKVDGICTDYPDKLKKIYDKI